MFKDRIRNNLLLIVITRHEHTTSTISTKNYPTLSCPPLLNFFLAPRRAAPCTSAWYPYESIPASNMPLPYALNGSDAEHGNERNIATHFFTTIGTLRYTRSVMDLDVYSGSILTSARRDNAT